MKNTSKRLLYFITRSDQIGGAHIHVRDLALAAISKGYEVLVVVGGTGFYYHQLKDLGINTLSIPGLSRDISIVRDAKSMLSLFQILREYHPDIVSAHSAKAGLLSRILRPFFPKSIFLFTAHGWSFADGIPTLARAFSFIVERVLTFFCDQIICVCNSDKDLAIRTSLCSPSKIQVIHNGMPELNLPDRSFGKSSPIRICCIARFERQKDHAVLIHALSRIPEFPWTLDLVGDGFLQSNIQALCFRLGLSTRVRFHGRVNNVVPLLQDADIFVLPSFWEGFPRSILEALRSSLPVIASDVGGVRESIIDGWNGFLVPASTLSGPDSWVAPLKSLMSSSSLRQKFGCNGRDLYEQNFTLQKTLDNTFALYSRILP